MSIDRVARWKKFSTAMEEYISASVLGKYGKDGDDRAMDLTDFSPPVTLLWNILKYSFRLWNGKAKGHDVFKIAHYAQILWEACDGNPDGVINASHYLGHMRSPVAAQPDEVYMGQDLELPGHKK